MRAKRDELGPLLTIAEGELARPSRRRDDRDLLVLRGEIEAQRREVARLTKQLMEAVSRPPGRGEPVGRNKLYRLRELMEILGLSRSTIYKWMQVGRFPTPVDMGGRLSRWRSEDVEAWLLSKGKDKA